MPGPLRGCSGQGGTHPQSRHVLHHEMQRPGSDRAFLISKDCENQRITRTIALVSGFTSTVWPLMFT